MRTAFSLVVLKQPHWVSDTSLLFVGSFPGGRFWGTPWLPSENSEKRDSATVFELSGAEVRTGLSAVE